MVLPLESVLVSSSGLLLESNWEFQLVLPLPSRSELTWASLLQSVSPRPLPLQLALATAAFRLRSE